MVTFASVFACIAVVFGCALRRFALDLLLVVLLYLNVCFCVGLFRLLLVGVLTWLCCVLMFSSLPVNSVVVFFL